MAIIGNEMWPKQLWSKGSDGTEMTRSRELTRELTRSTDGKVVVTGSEMWAMRIFKQSKSRLLDTTELFVFHTRLPTSSGRA